MRKTILIYIGLLQGIKCTNVAHIANEVASVVVLHTRCRFGFPRQVCESATLNCVEDSLKSRQKTYQLTRSDLEVRVNDYNPLILMLWKANMDIQFVAESSLALAHYVSGYVTKAERSNMQEVWQEVSENHSIYGRLWSFGIQSLRS